MTRIRAATFSLFILLSSVNTEVFSSDIDGKTREILDIYSNAISSNDTSSILDAIAEIEEKSTELQKPISSLPFNLSQLYFRAGKDIEAEKILREWDSAAATLYLGQYYIRTGEIEKAKTELRIHEDKITKTLSSKRLLQGLQNLICIWAFLGENIPDKLDFWKRKWNFTDQEILKAKEEPGLFERKMLEDMWKRI